MLYGTEKRNKPTFAAILNTMNSTLPDTAPSILGQTPTEIRHLPTIDLDASAQSVSAPDNGGCGLCVVVGWREEKSSAMQGDQNCFRLWYRIRFVLHCSGPKAYWPASGFLALQHIAQARHAEDISKPYWRTLLP